MQLSAEVNGACTLSPLVGCNSIYEICRVEQSVWYNLMPFHTTVSVGGMRPESGGRVSLGTDVFAHP